jgi:hypothetical protein
MDSKAIKKFTDFANWEIEVKIKKRRIIISKEIPSRIEIIERAFFGDDRERIVKEWEKKIILDIKIPKDKQDEVSVIKKTLGGNIVLNSIQYYELKNELILYNIETFDWDHLC